MMNSQVRRKSGSKTGSQISADAWQKRVDIANQGLRQFVFIESWRDLTAKELKAQGKTVARLAELMADDPYAEA